jgi:predicted house-cleaning NTP pyrophosphatase (Maf/HAM1 superfamily)
LAFEVASPKCDETPLSGEAPQDTAARLAVLKAKSLRLSDALVIGSD